MVNYLVNYSVDFEANAAAAHHKIPADAVIFDKDGTLMDFDAFWITLSDLALKDILRQVNLNVYLADEMLTAFGVQGDTVSVDGILCKGTYREMSECVHQILQSHGCEKDVDAVEEMVLSAYNRHAHESSVLPTCPHLRAVLETLKKQGKKLALITTDNREITLLCLEKLGVTELFDHIYTDDGLFPPKPAPAAAQDLCEKEKLSPDRVVMVGDTMTDIRFARNAGLKAIAVGKHAQNRSRLQAHADGVLHDVSELPGILE